ncbi:MAG TPA: pilin [bacterium]|nr:pilin [bacterium]
MKINRLVNFSIISLTLASLFLPQISLAAVTQCKGLGKSTGYTTSCQQKCVGLFPKAFPAGDGGCAQDSNVNTKCCGKKEDATANAATGNTAASNAVATATIKSLITATPADFIARIIRNILGLAGTLTMVMMVYGGLLWMTARGNQKMISQAQKIMIWTAIGLVIIFSSYTILDFLFKTLK